MTNHMDATKTLKQRPIGKKKAVDFMSTTLLDLKRGCEMELFKML
jgi:hypothetical protein